jgi:hypothetical protein
MAVLLLATTSARAGELDAEFSKKATVPARTPVPAVADVDVEEWLDAYFPMGSELDEESPTQSHYRWRGGYGWGGYRNYGYRGYYGGYRGYYGGYRGYYGGYRGYYGYRPYYGGYYGYRSYYPRYYGSYSYRW